MFYLYLKELEIPKEFELSSLTGTLTLIYQVERSLY